MGWHHFLTVRCKVLPEFLEFVKLNYLDKFYINDSDDEGSDYTTEEDTTKGYSPRKSKYEMLKELPKSYRDLIDIWNTLQIGLCCHTYDLNNDEFFLLIEKKVTRHRGDLKEDFLTFVRDVIVPISSEILECSISSDDFGCFKYEYTDSELRNIPFRLVNKVKSVEHKYSDDGNEIIETRVIYKHSIKKKDVLDLDREYGVRNYSF
jgi:hypothetical protein